MSTNTSAAYQSVLALDKSLRDEALPQPLRIGLNPTREFGPYEEGLALQRAVTLLTQQFSQSPLRILLPILNRISPACSTSLVFLPGSFRNALESPEASFRTIRVSNLQVCDRDN